MGPPDRRLRRRVPGAARGAARRDERRLRARCSSELSERGELLGGEALGDPASARLYRWDDGEPLATDGPYSEAKEHLAGFFLIDVESQRARRGDRGAVRRARATRSSCGPRCGRAATTSDARGTLEDVWRRESPHVLGGAAAPARRPRRLRGRRCRRRWRRRLASGRRDGMPENPRGVADPGRLAAADRPRARRRARAAPRGRSPPRPADELVAPARRRDRPERRRRLSCCCSAATRR